MEISSENDPNAPVESAYILRQTAAPRQDQLGYFPQPRGIIAVVLQRFPRARFVRFEE
jgi:hypothetical protein